VIFEAWDAGVLPVVFSGSGGAAEIISEADAGIIYEEQSPESLANALQLALRLDYDERTRLLNNGRLWLSKNCSPELYGNTISKILLDACALRHSFQ
jgi:glycosyltransferase involved in cell wall biosynthesis